VRGPTPRRLWKYVVGPLRLGAYFAAPGDGRVQPQIPAEALAWALTLGQVLRECSFHAVEALVRSPARRALRVGRGFGDDTLAYFTERLDPGPTRRALAATVRRAKRNKAFGSGPGIGLAIDGTGAGFGRAASCKLCVPVRDPTEQIRGYLHRFAMISVVGTGLALPFDVEPYGPGDSEYLAGQRLLERAIGQVGPRFADYVVVDSGFATAPFLHTAGTLGVPVVARLKDNLPTLLAAAEARFTGQPPTLTFAEGADRVELWDGSDFDPWTTLQWPTVRVLRYWQHKPDGTIVEAYWFTDLALQRVGSRRLYRFAKSRWEIENQGFNEGKSRHGMEHISHHHANSLLVGWLLTLLALTLERLYRVRYLHRGRHPVLTAIELVRALRLSLAPPRPIDTS
jgi:hypothetical protein